MATLTHDTNGYLPVFTIDLGNGCKIIINIQSDWDLTKSLDDFKNNISHNIQDEIDLDRYCTIVFCNNTFTFVLGCSWSTPHRIEFEQNDHNQKMVNEILDVMRESEHSRH